MQKTMIYIDINTKAQIKPDGEFVTLVADYPIIERGQWQVLCFVFVSRTIDEYGVITITPVSLNTASSYIVVGDSDYNDSDSLMFKSIQSVKPFDESDTTTNRINVQGDWVDGSTADMSSGQLSVRINSDTVKFTEVLANTQKIVENLTLCVKQYSTGLTNPSTIAHIPFVAVNTIRDWESQEEIPPSGEQLASFVDAAFKNAMEFQFSSNSVDWHTEQLSSDLYYRQRISNINGDWSSAIRFIYNTSGGGGGGSTDAADIIISAEAHFYAGMDVTAALQVIGAELDGLEAELEAI